MTSKAKHRSYLSSPNTRRSYAGTLQRGDGVRTIIAVALHTEGQSYTMKLMGEPLHSAFESARASGAVDAAPTACAACSDTTSYACESSLRYSESAGQYNRMPRKCFPLTAEAAY